MATILRTTVEIRGEKIDRHFLVPPGVKVHVVAKALYLEFGVMPHVVAEVPYNA